MGLSEELKAFARDQGADVVGIGSMDRFEGAPLDRDPRFIMPEATHIVGLGFRIHRGALRGIEEGTHFGSYPTLCYANVNDVHMPVVLRQVASFIEDQGYEAFPFGNSVVRMGTNCGRPVRPGYPRPDVFLHFRIAAFICGMGEIGWSKIFITPRFGPRIRLAFIITDAPLQADPLYEGPPLCNRCMQCVKSCPVGALGKEEAVKVVVAGRTLEWGRLDQHRCGLGWQTSDEAHNPFADEETVRYMRSVLADERPFEERQKDVWAPMKKLRESFVYSRSGWEYFKHPGAVCGAKGCLRACLISLEKRGVTQNHFHQPFRRRPEWKLESPWPE